MPEGENVVGRRADQAVRAEVEGIGCQETEPHAHLGVRFTRPDLNPTPTTPNSSRAAMTMSLISDITRHAEAADHRRRTAPSADATSAAALADLEQRIGLAGSGSQLLQDADGLQQDIQVLLVEVENVQEIGDRLGQCSADAALLVVARVLFVAFRPQDVLARIGPTTFLVLAAGLDRHHRAIITSRVRSNLASDDTVAFVGTPVRVSLGWATRKPADESWVGELVGRAARQSSAVIPPAPRHRPLPAARPHLQLVRGAVEGERELEPEPALA
jgi:diguanylate cyclase (GGDEF)-like protein